MTTPAARVTPAGLPHARSSAVEWERLSTRRIFFGHQSVGENIISGVRQLASDDGSARLRIVEAARPADVDGAALVHASIGRNYEPSSKNEAFLVALARSAPDIALYKYCYVDVCATTDVEAMFADYVRTIDEAQAMHPRLEMVHVTVPLTTGRPAGRARAAIKRMLGRAESAEAANNVRRERYNALLRSRYAGRAPIFDLAEIESTRSDGTRSTFMSGSERAYTLAAELTTDGGHLNPAGQRAAALGLLHVLARR